MKKLFLLLTALVMALSASGQIIDRANRLLYGNAADQGNQKARRIMAGESIRSYRDRNTNAVVSASATQDYTFFVVFGTIKLVNTAKDYIEVYECRSGDWQAAGQVHRNGPDTTIWTQTKQQPQLITFSKGSNGRLFVTVYSAIPRDGSWAPWAKLSSFTF